MDTNSPAFPRKLCVSSQKSHNICSSTVNHNHFVNGPTHKDSRVSSTTQNIRSGEQWLTTNAQDDKIYAAQLCTYYSSKIWLRANSFAISSIFMIYHYLFLQLPALASTKSNGNHAVILCFIIILHFLLISAELTLMIAQTKNFQWINPFNISQLFSNLIQAGVSLKKGANIKRQGLCIRKFETVFAYCFYFLNFFSCITLLVLSCLDSMIMPSNNFSSETTSLIFTIYFSSILNSKFLFLNSSSTFDRVTIAGHLLLLVLICVTTNYFTFCYFAAGGLGLAWITVYFVFYFDTLMAESLKQTEHGKVAMELSNYYKKHFEDYPGSYVIIDLNHKIKYSNKYFSNHMKNLTVLSHHTSSTDNTKFQTGNIKNLVEGEELKQSSKQTNFSILKNNNQSDSSTYAFLNKDGSVQHNKLYLKERPFNICQQNKLTLAADRMYYASTNLSDFSKLINLEVDPSNDSCVAQVKEINIYKEETLKSHIEEYMKKALDLDSDVGFTQLGYFKLNCEKKNKDQLLFNIQIRKCLQVPTIIKFDCENLTQGLEAEENMEDTFELYISAHIDSTKVEKKKIEKKIKNLLLSKISHEFKTPTISIQNIVQKIIQENNLKHILRESLSPLVLSIYDDLKRVKYLSEIILILISDLGDYINNDRHESFLKYSPNSKLNKSIMSQSMYQSIISLNELKRYIVQLSKNLLDVYSKRNMTLVVNYDVSINNKKIMLDDKKLKQILCNIISNAIKNNDRGPISISFINSSLGDDQQFQYEILKHKEVELTFNNFLHMNMISSHKPRAKSGVNLNEGVQSNCKEKQSAAIEPEEGKIETNTPSVNNKISSKFKANFPKIKIIEEENDMEESSSTNPDKNKYSIQESSPCQMLSHKYNNKQSGKKHISFDIGNLHDKPFSILIQDSGPGIRKDIIDKINSSQFLSYDHRLDDQNELGEYLDSKGIGVGLIICKRLCKELNIRLTCSSLKKKEGQLSTNTTKIFRMKSTGNLNHLADESADFKRSLTSELCHYNTLREITSLKQVANLKLPGDQEMKKETLSNFLSLKYPPQDWHGSRFTLEFNHELMIDRLQDEENESDDSTSYLQSNFHEKNVDDAIKMESRSANQSMQMSKQSNMQPSNSAIMHDPSGSCLSSQRSSNKNEITTTIQSQSGNLMLLGLNSSERDKVSFDYDSASSIEEAPKLVNHLNKIRRTSRSCENVHSKIDSSFDQNISSKKTIHRKDNSQSKTSSKEKYEINILVPDNTNIENILKLQNMNVSPRKAKQLGTNNYSGISKNTTSLITNSIFANSNSQNNVSSNATTLTEEFAFKRQSILNKLLETNKQRKNTIFSFPNPGGSIIFNGSVMSAFDNKPLNAQQEDLSVSLIPKMQRKSMCSQNDYFMLDPDNKTENLGNTCNEGRGSMLYLENSSPEKKTSIKGKLTKRKSTFTFQRIEDLRHNSCKDPENQAKLFNRVSNFNLNRSMNSMYNLTPKVISQQNFSHKNSIKNQSLSIIRDSNLNESNDSSTKETKIKVILIVEDNDNILKSHYTLLKKFLAAKGLLSSYKILMLKDGFEALYHVYKDVRDNLDSIKLILTDEMMNYLNGSELFELITHKILAKSNRSSIPFIIASAFNNNSHFEKISKLGVGFISKPLNKGNIQFIYENYLVNKL